MPRTIARGKALVAKLRAQPGVRDPEALAAELGRRKHLRQAAKKAKGKVKGAANNTAGNYDPNRTGGHWDNLKDADSWAKEAYSPWFHSLDKGEVIGLRAYTGASFGPINDDLRNKDANQSSYAAAIKNIDRAIDRSPPLSRDVTVHRGRLPTPVLEAFRDGVHEGLIGKTVSDPAYYSTTVDRDTAISFGGSTKFSNKSMGRITLPKGSKAAYLETITSNKGEYEFLLPRNATVKITDAYVDKEGIWVIDAEYVP